MEESVICSGSFLPVHQKTFNASHSTELLKVRGVVTTGAPLFAKNREHKNRVDPMGDMAMYQQPMDVTL